MIDVGLFSFNFFLKGLASIVLATNIATVYLYKTYVEGVNVPVIAALSTNMNEMYELIIAFNNLGDFIETKAHKGFTYIDIIKNGELDAKLQNYNPKAKTHIYNIIAAENRKNPFCTERLVDLMDLKVKFWSKEAEIIGHEIGKYSAIDEYNDELFKKTFCIGAYVFVALVTYIIIR
jgi:hypothetical protein